MKKTIQKPDNKLQFHIRVDNLYNYSFNEASEQLEVGAITKMYGEYSELDSEYPKLNVSKYVPSGIAIFFNTDKDALQDSDNNYCIIFAQHTGFLLVGVPDGEGGRSYRHYDRLGIDSQRNYYYTQHYDTDRFLQFQESVFNFELTLEQSTDLDTIILHIINQVFN